MISRFFKKKTKAKPQVEPIRKAAPKKPAIKTPVKKEIKKDLPAKSIVSKAPTPKNIDEPLCTETHHFPLPTLKPGKIITAEGWKRMMMRKISKK